jgi:phosphomannomutase
MSNVEMRPLYLELGLVYKKIEMKDRLRISVSGIRGEVPGALNVEVVSKFSSAFTSTLEKGRIAVSRDSRISSHMLAMAVLSSVMAGGLDCADFGLLPTPFLQFLMGKEKHSGGIAITGGHNPGSWNAVILLDTEGDYLDISEGSEVFNTYEAGDFVKASWKEMGRTQRVTFPMDLYLEELSRFVDTERIKKMQFKVVADPCNGAFSPFLADFGDYFNLDLIPINNNPEKSFPHLPEPTIENASQVEAVVGSTGADLGFLLNSDSSRISFVSENGIAFSEEMTFPLALLSLKNRIDQAITTTVTTSWADWAAQNAGIRLSRTKVGQSSVVHVMESVGAEAGGEGSGSLCLLDFSLGYDSILTLALILDYMAREEKSLTALTSFFPENHMRKIKVDVPPERTYRVMDRLEEIYSQENPDYTDGIRVERKGVWFNIRPSSTEFVLRITIEGEKQEDVDSVEDELRNRMQI